MKYEEFLKVMEGKEVAEKLRHVGMSIPAKVLHAIFELFVLCRKKDKHLNKPDKPK